MSICSLVCEFVSKPAVASDLCTSYGIGVTRIKQRVEDAGKEEQPGAGCENQI